MPVENRRLTSAVERSSRFELAPPRRFILPAILLLLSERPGYGYELVSRLEEFDFGHVDRPAVYRALAQLEADRLAEASAQNPVGGQARRVYCVTPLGERVLRAWMGVVKLEQDSLAKVLRRYQATGTTDAALAEVEGAWGPLAAGLSPISPTSGARRHLVPVGEELDAPLAPSRLARQPGSEPQRFRLVPERSVVLVEARSSVGPLSFGAVGVSGWFDAAVASGGIRTDVTPHGQLEIDVAGLRSGNRVHDAELLRRIDARRHPSASVELEEWEAGGPGTLYRVRGTLTFHGISRPAQGTVNIEVASERLVITGEQVFDIRDFAIPSPTVLMLRIYPDVQVRLHVEAELEGP